MMMMTLMMMMISIRRHNGKWGGCMRWFFIGGLFREIRIDEWDRQFVKQFTIYDEKLFDIIIVRFNAFFLMNNL